MYSKNSNPRIARSPARTDSFNSSLLMWFLLLHIPLGFILNSSEIFSTFHAIVVILTGIYFGVTSKNPYQVIYIMAYITGAELLWRGTHANIFWETGKYSITLLSIIGLLRFRKKQTANLFPLLYILLLLPSIFILPAFDREAIAFSLAGPMAIAFSCVFFDKITITRVQLKKILLHILAPIISWGILVLFGVLSAEEIVFSSGSNFTTSGGIGPNQVSSILGLGAFISFLFIILDNKHRLMRAFIIGIMIWLIAQTFLTFSRGGLWTTIGAIFVGVTYFL